MSNVVWDSSKPSEPLGVAATKDAKGLGQPNVVLMASNPTDAKTPGSGDAVALPMGYNGATWDRMRNNTEGTLLASAARTATTNTSNQTNYNARGVIATLYVTVPSGTTETLQVVARYVDPVSGANTNPVVAFPTIDGTVAAGIYRFVIYPGTVETVATSNLEVQGIPLPRTWLISIVHSGTSSWTYSLGYQYII